MRFAILLALFATPAMAGEPAYEWRPKADDPDRIYLYRDGRQVGGWCYRNKHYRTFDGTEWGTPVRTAPTPPPAQRAVIITPRSPVVMQTPLPVPNIRGPLRRRAATVMSDAIVTGTMQVFEQIPGAILDSVLKGNVKMKFEGQATAKP
jgi:hypothetical protein